MIPFVAKKYDTFCDTLWNLRWYKKHIFGKNMTHSLKKNLAALLVTLRSLLTVNEGTRTSDFQLDDLPRKSIRPPQNLIFQPLHEFKGKRGNYDVWTDKKNELRITFYYNEKRNHQQLVKCIRNFSRYIHYKFMHNRKNGAEGCHPDQFLKCFNCLYLCAK